MNKTRKALALLLAAALCLGMLPMAAMADGDVAQVDNGDSYATLQEAVNAVSGSGTITLLQDTKGDITIPADAVITLDLNGCTLTNESGNTISIESGGTLTIAGNGTVDNVTNKCAAVYNNGTLTIEGGTFTRSAEDPKTNNGDVSNTHYVIENHETITKISGGVFYTGDGTSAALGNCRDLIYNSGTIELISGGTFTSADCIIYNKGGSIESITGGSFTMDNTENKWATHGAIVRSDDNGSIESITGGTFEATGSGSGWDYGYRAGFETVDGSIAEIGGSVTLTMIGDNNCGFYASNGSISIVGGTYSVTTTETNGAGSTMFSVANGSISVSGGTFSEDVSYTYLANGYSSTDNGDGTYTVSETAAPAVPTTSDEEWTIPIALTVELDGNTEPEATTFAFEIAHYNDYDMTETEKAEFASGLDYAVNKITTSGSGTYEFNLEVIISSTIANEVSDGAYVRQVIGSEEGWEYDETEYFITYSSDGIYYWENNESYLLKSYLAFTNTYTKNTYTLTFDTSGGSTIDPVTAAAGTDIDLSLSKYTPTRENYTFVGWYLDSAEVTSVTLSGDITVYAEWTAKSNCIENDGTTYTVDDDGKLEARDYKIEIDDIEEILEKILDDYSNITDLAKVWSDYYILDEYYWNVNGVDVKLGNVVSLEGGDYLVWTTLTWSEDGVAYEDHDLHLLSLSDGTFRPDEAITREQLAAILYCYAQYKGYDVSIGEDTNILSYNDAAEISEYVVPALQWAVGAGLIEGTDTATLAPQQSAARAQIAAILMRFIENIR